MKKLYILMLGALVAASAGAESPYYTNDFSAKSFEATGFSQIDANADGVEWTKNSSTTRVWNLDGEKLADATYMYMMQIKSGTHDDWLVSPSIRFEAGKAYKLTILLGKPNYAAMDDAYEVKLASSKEASAFTTTLMPLEDGDFPALGSTSLWTRTAEINVPATGDYYVGIHATGKLGQTLYVGKFEIAQGKAMATPAAVTDLTLTPAADGDKAVEISFTAPTLAKDGSALTALEKIEVRRGDDLVKTFDAPALGQQLTCTDNVAVSGLYTYTVTAFTEAGAGEAVSAKTFVGVNVPAAVTDVAVANASTRSAKISWTAPTLDKDGFPISASLLRYDVWRHPLYQSSEKVRVAENITVCTYTDILPDDLGTDSQQFYIYTVQAKTAEGSAADVESAALPLGKPYDAPFLESFPGGRATGIYTSATISERGYNRWQTTKDWDDVASADADNGMLYLDGGIGGAARLYLGLVDLGTLSAPTLSYYTYSTTDCDPADHQLQVSVYAADGTSKAFEISTPGMDWQKTILPLDEMAGKVVRFEISGYRNNSTYLHLDAIKVSDIFRHDLRAVQLVAPAEARTDEPFTLSVHVLNSGIEPSGDYTVELYLDGAKVDTYSGTALATGATDVATFTRTHGVFDPDRLSYSAKVVYAADLNPTDNDLAAVEIPLKKNSYPTVTTLSGTVAEGAVKLVWAEPDTEKARPFDTLETFESFPSWANTGLGEWTLVDLDKAPITGYNGVTMPGIPDYSLQSWWVGDNSTEGFNTGSFATLSGHKFLASMICGTKEQGAIQNDDWAISPELYGGEQTVTVNARSYSSVPSEAETFEVLYSTGSLEPADFVSAGVKADIPAAYEAYTFDLPDGAKRFAIRNISLGRHTLMVDDVTYTGVGDPAAFSINGYNVYRDGERINTAPVEECEFTDSGAPAGTHTYAVTVLYTAGESRPGNEYIADTAGVENVAADLAPAEYYNLQGLRVAHPESGHIYIVRRGTTTDKVLY